MWIISLVMPEIIHIWVLLLYLIAINIESARFYDIFDCIIIS